MDWVAQFLADAEKMFSIPKAELEKFVQYMSSEPEKVQEWAEKLQIDEGDLLMLTTLYILYKTEEKVFAALSDLELKVDEAVGLASTIAANILNALPEEERRPILAQLILAMALQVEDAAIRNSLAEYARVLLAE